MARYKHLPIYKTAMDLVVYLEQVVWNFSRYHMYTLGSELRQQSRELVTVIIRANSRREKGPVLEELREWGINLTPVIQRLSRCCHSSFPITRLATAMHDGNNQKVFRFDGVQHSIGEDARETALDILIEDSPTFRRFTYSTEASSTVSIKRRASTRSRSA